MPRVDIGGTIVDFPDTLSGDELNKAVSSAASQIGPQKKERGLVGKAWDALALPEQKSREGLKMLAGMVPNPEPQGRVGMLEKIIRGSVNQPPDSPITPQPGVITDVLRGAPRVAADTMAEAAPGFVSRGALLMSGGAKLAGGMAPAAKAMLRGIGAQGEELSGIAPKAEGALEAAYKDPTLIFSKGKKAASGLYEAAKDELNAAKGSYRATSMGSDGVVNAEKISDILKGDYKPEVILDKANAFIAGGGKLEPAEAFKVRKAIDSLLKSKSYVPDELYRMRDEYDALAKASGNISEADKVFKRGMNAQALRNVFPQNKYGGASAFKLGIMTALENMGLPGKAAMMAISPLAQGAAATGAGMMARGVLSPIVNSPSIAMGLSAALSRRKEKSNAR